MTTKLYDLPALTSLDEYHAAQAMIEEYMYRNDAQAEAVQEKLFALVAVWETEHEEERVEEIEDFDECEDLDDFEDEFLWP